MSAASSHEEFSNPFESPGPAARVGYVGEEVPLPDVPLPGANAYENGGGDVNSTFGAYDVAANQGGEMGIEMGAAPTSNRGGSSFRSSATAAFKSAFGGRSSNAAPSGSAFGGGGGMGGVSSASLAAQQRDLERREQEILRRERDLEARERAVRDGPRGGPGAPNWPFKWYAITYHSIADEIPPVHKRCVTLCYVVYVLFSVAMFSNCLVAFVRVFQKGDLSSFLMAFIYMVCGIPGAWTLWYRRVYNSCKANRAFGFLWFFLMFLLHIGFVTFAALAPPGFFGAQQWATCGLLNLTQALNSHKVIGIMHATVMSMLMTDALLSIICIRMVYASFRSDGHSIQQAREEAYREGARAAVSGGVGSGAV